jgi:hypothetical protein
MCVRIRVRVHHCASTSAAAAAAAANRAAFNRSRAYFFAAASFFFFCTFICSYGQCLGACTHATDERSAREVSRMREDRCITTLRAAASTHIVLRRRLPARVPAADALIRAMQRGRCEYAVPGRRIIVCVGAGIERSLMAGLDLGREDGAHMQRGSAGCNLSYSFSRICCSSDRLNCCSGRLSCSYGRYDC